MDVDSDRPPSVCCHSCRRPACTRGSTCDNSVKKASPSDHLFPRIGNFSIAICRPWLRRVTRFQGADPSAGDRRQPEPGSTICGASDATFRPNITCMRGMTPPLLPYAGHIADVSDGHPASGRYSGRLGICRTYSISASLVTSSSLANSAGLAAARSSRNILRPTRGCLPEPADHRPCPEGVDPGGSGGRRAGADL